MKYLDKGDLDNIFESIKDILDNKEDKLPDYFGEKNSCENYIGVLSRVKLDYSRK